MMIPVLHSRVISEIIYEVEENLERSSFLEDFRMIELPNLRDKFAELLELLVSLHISGFSLIF